MFSQIFNADWLKIEMKDIRCKDHDYSDFSNQKISQCEDRDYNDSSSHENEAYLHKSRNFCCKVYERILIISRNFDAKKRARVRNAEFKICEMNFVCEMNSSRI